MKFLQVVKEIWQERKLLTRKEKFYIVFIVCILFLMPVALVYGIMRELKIWGLL